MYLNRYILRFKYTIEIRQQTGTRLSTPLTFAGHPIAIAVHFRAGTMLDEKEGFFARGHVRTMGRALPILGQTESYRLIRPRRRKPGTECIDICEHPITACLRSDKAKAFLSIPMDYFAACSQVARNFL